MRGGHWGRDRGAATVLAIALVPLLVVVAVTGTLIGSVAVTRGRVETVADLAALAGAQSLDDACATAARVAAANAMTLTTCLLEDADVRVEVAGRLPPAAQRVIGLLGAPAAQVTATARAGPPSG